MIFGDGIKEREEKMQDNVISINCENFSELGQGIKTAGTGLAFTRTYQGDNADWSRLTVTGLMNSIHADDSTNISSDGGLKGRMENIGTIMVQYANDIKVVDNNAQQAAGN